MTTITAPSPTHRAHSVEAHPALRRRRSAVVRWALGRGLPVNRDALAAILGARALLSGSLPQEPDQERWSAEDVGALLWVGVTEWCRTSNAALPHPSEVRDSILTYIRFLSAHRLLDRGSDPVAALRSAVNDYGGGRSPAHPAVSSRLAPVVPIA